MEIFHPEDEFSRLLLQITSFKEDLQTRGKFLNTFLKFNKMKIHLVTNKQEFKGQFYFKITLLFY